MKKVIALSVVAFVLAGAGRTFAQTPQERVDTALARAREAGIPVALLEAKIAEGKAKGVSMERIAAAVERRSAALEHASEAMRGQAGIGPTELAVGADAIEAGVSDVVLHTLAETAPRDRRAVAIAALEQLVQLGHTPEKALERVREALQHGPDALLNLPAEAARAAGRRGGPSDEAPGPRIAGSPTTGSPSGVPAPGSPAQPSRPDGAGRPTTGPGAPR